MDSDDAEALAQYINDRVTEALRPESMAAARARCVARVARLESKFNGLGYARPARTAWAIEEARHMLKRVMRETLRNNGWARKPRGWGD